jgi:hypothetical protein
MLFLFIFCFFSVCVCAVLTRGAVPTISTTLRKHRKEQGGGTKGRERCKTPANPCPPLLRVNARHRSRLLLLSTAVELPSTHVQELIC